MRASCHSTPTHLLFARRRLGTRDFLLFPIFVLHWGSEKSGITWRQRGNKAPKAQTRPHCPPLTPLQLLATPVLPITCSKRRIDPQCRLARHRVTTQAFCIESRFISGSLSTERVGLTSGSNWITSPSPSSPPNQLVVPLEWVLWRRGQLDYAELAQY